MSAGQVLLGLAPLWPLLLAAGLAAPRLRTALSPIVRLAALPALLLALLPEGEYRLSLPWLLLGTELALDPLGRGFLLFTALLWLTAGLAPVRTPGRGFSIGWLLALAGNLAVLLVRDLPGFLMAYGLMSLSVYGLILEPGGVRARRAANLYLVLVMLGEGLLLAALLMTGTPGEGSESARMGLLLAGFGIKTGLVPLHLALPPVYRVLPLIAAVPVAGAMVQAGLYGWLRFLPLGLAPMPEWGTVVSALGALSMALGLAAGLAQREPRGVLAYSSISATGTLLVGLGIGLTAPGQAPALMAVLTAFAVSHGLAKGALFYGLGVSGPGRLGLWIPALVLAGFPLAGGDLAKSAMKGLAATLDGPGAPAAVWLLALGGVTGVVLMGRFLYLAAGAGAERTGGSGLRNGPWVLLLSAVLVLPWTEPPPHYRMDLWGSLWPLFLGTAVLAVLGIRQRRRGVPTSEAWALRMWRYATRGSRRLGGWGQSAPAPREGPDFAAFLGWMEGLTPGWRVTVALLLATLILLALALGAGGAQGP